MEIIKNNRKFNAFISDEHIKLLENSGILGVGRNSQCSEWLRNIIEREFGNNLTLLNFKKKELKKVEEELNVSIKKSEDLRVKCSCLKKEIEIFKKKQGEELKKMKEKQKKHIIDGIKEELKEEFEKLKEIWRQNKINDDQFYGICDIKNPKKQLKEIKKLNIIYYI